MNEEVLLGKFIDRAYELIGDTTTPKEEVISIYKSTLSFQSPDMTASNLIASLYGNNSKAVALTLAEEFYGMSADAYATYYAEHKAKPN